MPTSSSISASTWSIAITMGPVSASSCDTSLTRSRGIFLVVLIPQRRRSPGRPRCRSGSSSRHPGPPASATPAGRAPARCPGTPGRSWVGPAQRRDEDLEGLGGRWHLPGDLGAEVPRKPDAIRQPGQQGGQLVAAAVGERQQLLYDGAEHLLPEGLGEQVADQEEVAAGALRLRPGPAEQVGLADAALPLDDDAERPGGVGPGLADPGRSGRRSGRAARRRDSSGPSTRRRARGSS